LAAYFSHLGLIQWPFSVVPRPEHCTFVAGRKPLRDDIYDLLRALSRRDTSSIQVLWSWFGAGKTHALFYLAHQAVMLNDQQPAVSITPIYTEFPKSARTFVDLYRSFAPRLDVARIVEDYLEVTTSPYCEIFVAELGSVCPDLASALRVMSIQEGLPKTIATRWLRGENVTLHDLRGIGISQRITTTDQAVQVLSMTIQILVAAAKSRGLQGARLLWLIDEFQRVARSGPKAIGDVNVGLHSLFNACPTGLTPVLSFSGSPDEKNLPDWFSRELRDRIGATRVMVLPPLQPDQALIFVKDVLAHFRPDGYEPPSEYFPFSQSACAAVISHLLQQASLLPRILMHAFNAVLEAADPLIEGGELGSITPEFASKVLSEYVIVSDSQD